MDTQRYAEQAQSSAAQISAAQAPSSVAHVSKTSKGIVIGTGFWPGSGPRPVEVSGRKARIL